MMNRAPDFIVGRDGEKHERVMQFIGVGCFWPGFFFDFFNRAGIENSQAVAMISFRSTASVNRLSSSLFKRRIVQERVWPRVQNFGCEWRRLRQITRDAADFSVLDFAQYFFETIDVH